MKSLLSTLILICFVSSAYPQIVRNDFSQNSYQGFINLYLKDKPSQIVTWVYWRKDYFDSKSNLDSSIYDISDYDTLGNLTSYKYWFNGDGSYNIALINRNLDTLNNKRKIEIKKTEFNQVRLTAFALPAEQIKCKYKNYFLIKRTSEYKRKTFKEKTEEYFSYYKDESLKEVIIFESHKMKRTYKFVYTYP